MRPQIDQYFRSLSAELDVQADRVRSLIGSRHWLSDGGHKEALLRGLIERHMPAATVVSRGFLVSSAAPTECSREQDLIIVDTSSDPPLFNYGGLVVTASDHVYACLSVKSRFAKDEFLDSLTTFASVPRAVSGSDVFFGSYHFGDDSDDSPSLEALADTVSSWLPHESDRVSMVVRVSPNVFFVLDTREVPHRLRLYNASNGATAFFIARLLNHVAVLRATRPSLFADALDSAGTCNAVHEVLLRPG